MVGPADSLLQLNMKISYTLDAFECNYSLVPIPILSYQQGDVIRICIKPGEVAENDGLSMRKIDSMSFQKDGIEDYFAIFGGQEDFLGFSELFCTSGSPICYVDTLLKAEWFAEQGFVEVSGIATLQFGSSRRRRSLSSMNDEDQQRVLQLGENNDKELGRFSVKFPVTTFQETMVQRNNNNDNIVSQTQAVLLVVLCFLQITSCIFVLWIRHTRQSRKSGQEKYLLNRVDGGDDDIEDCTNIESNEKDYKHHDTPQRKKHHRHRSP